MTHIKNDSIIEKIVKIYLIVVFVLGCGSLYFQILHMPLMAMLMIIGICVSQVYKKSVDVFNFLFVFIFIVTSLILSLINVDFGFHLNDLIILALNLFYVFSLTCVFTFSEFITLFVKIMFFESILSLFCFFIGNVLGFYESFPFYMMLANSSNTFMLTPYFTIGWTNIGVFDRNAGIFREPGNYQIFLNFSICCLLFLKSQQHIKHRKLYLLIFIITVLTTKSTTAYINFALIFLFYLFVFLSKSKNNKKKWMKFAAILVICLFLIVELNNGVIMQKLSGISTGQGSGGTRFNDSIQGFLVSLERPWVGYGPFNTELEHIFAEKNVINISNGFMSALCRYGYLFLFLFLLLFIKKSYRLFDFNFSFLIIIFFFVICWNTSGDLFNLLTFSIVFNWQNDFGKMRFSLLS